MNSSGYSRSFQWMTNRKIAVAAIEGADSGRAIRREVRKGPAPSIELASNIDLGSVFMNPPMMKVATGRVIVMLISTRPSRLSSSPRSEEHTSELQSRFDLVCRLLLEKKNYKQ